MAKKQTGVLQAFITTIPRFPPLAPHRQAVQEDPRDGEVGRIVCSDGGELLAVVGSVGQIVEKPQGLSGKKFTLGGI